VSDLEGLPELVGETDAAAIGQRFVDHRVRLDPLGVSHAKPIDLFDRPEVATVRGDVVERLQQTVGCFQEL